MEASRPNSCMSLPSSLEYAWYSYWLLLWPHWFTVGMVKTCDAQCCTTPWSFKLPLQSGNHYPRWSLVVPQINKWFCSPWIEPHAWPLVQSKRLPLPTWWNSKSPLGPFEALGAILPITSMPYIEKGHGKVMLNSSLGGTWFKFACVWQSWQLFTKSTQSISIVFQ